MKAKYAKYAFCACAMLATSGVYAQGSCTNAVFNGTYIFHDQGSVAVVLSLIPYGSAGQLLANGDGTGTIAETTSTGGTIAPKAAAFTYSLKPGAPGSSCDYGVNTDDGRSFDLYLGADGSYGTFIATGPGQAIVGELHRK